MSKRVKKILYRIYSEETKKSEEKTETQVKRNRYYSRRYRIYNRAEDESRVLNMN